MNKDRKNAIIVGVLIIFAYAVLASSVIDSKIVIMISQVLSGLAVIGIAIIMYPLFKSYGKKVSFLYIVGRSIEGGLMIIAGILFLISSFSSEFITKTLSYKFARSIFCFNPR